MADLNDPVDAAKAKEPAVSDKAVSDKAVSEKTAADTTAASDETSAADEAPTPDKPETEKPATEKPAEPAAADKPAETEPATEAAAETKPATEAATETKPATEAATETKPATEAATETKPATEAATETEPATEAATETEPETKPAETKPAGETDTETESGTVLPDSVVAGAAAPAGSATSAGDEADDAGAGDLQEPPSAKPAKKARKPISRPRPLVAALSLLLVVLLAAGVTLFVHNHKVSAAEASRAAALDTARSVATSLTTITPDNAAGQIDDLTKHSTGSFKEQIGGYSAMFQAVLKQGNVASRGTITAAGIEKMEGDAASAIVAVSALITSGQVPQGQPRTYRLLVSLQRTGDQWLASNVDFVQ